MNDDDLFRLDVLIIGSGAGGLTTALALPRHLKVGVLSKGALSAGATAWAQGGIAAVLDDQDSFESHVADTIDAGAGLNHPDAVRMVVEQAPAAVHWLSTLGVPWNSSGDRQQPLHLTREGGHSANRIAHVDDATGAAVQRALEQRALAADNIQLFTQRIGVDLITERHVPGGGERRCHGAYVLNLHSQKVERFLAKATVLATGGASRVYLFSTNPDGATGDGIAMAWRAGCRVANMEFNQFHPTCLYNSKVKSFLITEAMRGEGGRLTLPDGTAFMARFDPRAELAPRDIVARAIDFEMKRHGLKHVYLSIAHKPADFVQTHFPMIAARLLELGLDITRQAIPVVPAAHYTCGGIAADLAGRTDLRGLYAVGECAHTGLHGANRLASNSLLECLVFGKAAAASIAEKTNHWSPPRVPAPWDESRVTPSDEAVVVTHNWDELRRFMWDYVGIVRTTKRLQRARHRADMLLGEIDAYYSSFRVTRDLLELRNLATVAQLIVRSAQSRQESRGLHYTLDFPALNPVATDTILAPWG